MPSRKNNNDEEHVNKDDQESRPIFSAKLASSSQENDSSDNHEQEEETILSPSGSAATSTAKPFKYYWNLLEKDKMKDGTFVTSRGYETDFKESQNVLNTFCYCVLTNLCEREGFDGDLMFFRNNVLLSSKKLPGCDEDGKWFVINRFPTHELVVHIQEAYEAPMSYSNEDAVLMMEGIYLDNVVPLLIHSPTYLQKDSNAHQSSRREARNMWMVPANVSVNDCLLDEYYKRTITISLIGVQCRIVDRNEFIVIGGFTSEPFDNLNFYNQMGEEIREIDRFEEEYHLEIIRPDLPGVIDMKSKRIFPAEMLIISSDVINTLVDMAKAEPVPYNSARDTRDENRILGSPFTTREEFLARTIPSAVNTSSTIWNPLTDQSPHGALALRKEAKTWYFKSMSGMQPEYNEPFYGNKEQSSRFYTNVPFPRTDRRPPTLYFVKKLRVNGSVTLEAVDALVYYEFSSLRYLLMDEKVEDIVSHMRGLDQQHLAVGDLIWVNRIIPAEDSFVFDRRTARVIQQTRCCFKVDLCSFVEPTAKIERLGRATPTQLTIAGEDWDSAIENPSPEELSGIVTVDFRKTPRCIKCLSAVPNSVEAEEKIFSMLVSEFKQMDFGEEKKIMKIEKLEGVEDVIKERAEEVAADARPEWTTVVQLVQLGTTGLIHDERAYRDLEERVLRVEKIEEVGEGEKKRFIYQAIIEAKTKDEGWCEGSDVVINAENLFAPCTVRILRSTIDQAGQTIRFAAGNDQLEKVTARLVEPFVRTAHARVRKGVNIPAGSKGAAILKAIYEDHVEVKNEVVKRATIKLYGVERMLDPEQKKFVQLASSLACHLLYVDAGPGCGKSFVLGISVIETILCNKDAFVIVTAVTNTAVSVATQSVERFKHNESSVRILHHHSKNDEVTTDSDLTKIILSDFPHEESAKKLAECLKKMKEIRESHFDPSSMSAEELLEMDELGKKTARIKKAYLRRVLKRQNVLCITVDGLLNTMNARGGVLAQFIRSQKDVVIFVDEASQLPESSMLALTEAFPGACQRYCGDPRQLPPFCNLKERGFFGDFGAFSVAKLLERSTAVERVTLRECRRMDHRIGIIASSLFYVAPLVFSHRSTAPFMPALFGHRAPLLFVELDDGKDKATASGSRYNEREVEMVDRLTRKFGLEANPESLRIIPFYKEQASRMKLRNPRLTVGTADSSQGSEADIVILMTTRTSGELEFVSEKHRLNVALTRAKKGLVIVGSRSTLTQHEYWKWIIEQFEENGRSELASKLLLNE